MNTIDDFMTLVRDEIGLPVTTDDAYRGFDDVPGWDSMHLLTLLVLLERRTGRQIAMPDVLTAASLQDIYALAVAP